MKQQAQMTIHVSLSAARTDKAAVMDNVRLWRRQHHLPAAGRTKQEFDLEFNSVGNKLKQGRVV